MNKFHRKDQAPLCACGCGEKVNWNKGGLNKWNKFISGHNSRGKKLSNETRRKISIAQQNISDKTRLRQTGKTHSEATKLKISISEMRRHPDDKYCEIWRDEGYKKDCRKNHCEICGTKEIKKIQKDGKLRSNLLLHHKDLDPKNCHPDNLPTLCISCHIKLHFKLKREKGNPPDGT